MTTAQLLNDLLDELSEEQRAEFRGTYGRIQQLPGSELPLQAFLDDFLRETVNLFAATAGVIWFREADGSGFQANTRLGFDRHGITGELADRHRELVGFAFQQTKPLVVNPYSSPQAGANVSNPTDSFIVFGPAVAGGQAIGVIELLLGPTPVRGRTSGDRDRYRLWLDHLLGFFCQGIERRLLRQAAPLDSALLGLEEVRDTIGHYQTEIRHAIEQMLARFAGWNFGSLKENQAFAKQVHQLLDENGLRAECTECGAPAILRCQAAGNSKTGVFLFDHYLDTGRTFHGGRSQFPKLRLVIKPPRRTKSDT
ncbi:MAG: GAF domain-containing protein [Planctomycetales bacterium]|nr:GAF domain-containing protein [Planctomycetales bacterium]